MAVPTLVYCADGNRRFAEIAINAGYRYGAQMPRTVYFDPWFCDQDWRKPNRKRYMAALAKHRPHMASVLDLEQESQLDEVLSWSEDATQWVDVVMIIPKIFSIIEKLPRSIGSKQVRLGFSVPTKFAGTSVPCWEFGGWPVHLLGGSPHKQMELAHYMNVHSADGNYANLMATKYNKFWHNSKWHELAKHGGHVDHDAPYVAFERSCKNIMEAWRRL